jgi:potassium-transporting ATPase KdpC subunit
MGRSIRFPKPLALLFAMTALCGIAYPALVTGIAWVLFPSKSGGSLIAQGGQVRGSALLAQGFSSPRFFKARPSAVDYAAVGAGASNLGPTSADLAKAVAERREAWLSAFGAPVPREMLYASASGVDPDISLEAALAQAPAVSAARGLDAATASKLVAIIRKAAKARSGPIDPPLVNVVELNVLLESDPAFARKGR